MWIIKVKERKIGWKIHWKKNPDKNVCTLLEWSKGKKFKKCWFSSLLLGHDVQNS